MSRAPRHAPLLIPLLFLAFACTESPTAPAPTQIAPEPPERSILTPFILPPGADWGHYFASFNRDRTLDVSVFGERMHAFGGERTRRVVRGLAVRRGTGIVSRAR